MQIKYEKMSLFDAPEGAIIVHAATAQGVWGSGIAKEFKERYPESFKEYQEHCKNPKIHVLGSGTITITFFEDHRVGWIITSENYGNKKDSKAAILGNTALAIDSLCKSVNNDWVMNKIKHKTIYSNKFNSGLFAVPWEDTEEVLKSVLKRYPNISWIICDPNLESE